MTPVEILRRARELLKGGWSGPSGEQKLLEKSKRSDGSQCLWNDEGVARFSVQGALNQAASASPDADRIVLVAWAALERVAAPGWWSAERSGRMPPADKMLADWLKESHRSQFDVLGAFDRAIAISKSEERRNA